ncbi:MAG TPA: hypothetical protein VF796_13855 [Humisphaera sp.]
MPGTRPTYQLLDTFVHSMTAGRVPTHPTFVCPACLGPAQASASPRGDALSVSVRCPCSGLELDGVPKWPGWEALLSPPPAGFVADPLGLTRRRRPRVWIAFDDHRRRTTAPCPHCGAPLPTAQARQCFVCRTDWHDPRNVVRRPDPEWDRLGLEWRTPYAAELCQSPDRRRYVVYRRAEGGTPDPHRVFDTPAHPGWRWVAWGEHGFGGAVAATTGEAIVFDADGVWLTWDEVRGLHRHARGEVTWSDVPWATDAPPAFAAGREGTR